MTITETIAHKLIDRMADENRMTEEERTEIRLDQEDDAEQGKCLSCGQNLHVSDNDPEFCTDCQRKSGNPTSETIDITPDIKLGQKVPEPMRFSLAKFEYERRTGKPYPFEDIDYPQKNISVLPPAAALDWTTILIAAVGTFGIVAALYGCCK